jgi:hypothetical protein
LNEAPLFFAGRERLKRSKAGSRGSAPAFGLNDDSGGLTGSLTAPQGSATLEGQGVRGDGFGMNGFIMITHGSRAFRMKNIFIIVEGSMTAG